MQSQMSVLVICRLRCLCWLCCEVCINKEKTVKFTRFNRKVGYFAGLFNLRGQDIAYNPVFFAYAVVEADRSKYPILFLREASTRKGSLTVHLQAESDGTCRQADCVEVCWIWLSVHLASQFSVAPYNSCSSDDCF